MKVNYRQVLKRGPAGQPSDSPPCPTHRKLVAFIQLAWHRLIRSPSPHFAKYRPAPRLGTRRVEQRLLHRLTRAETAC
jgi:hypothetical protein